MNINEFGNKIRVNVGEDISTNINTLILKSPIPKPCTKIFLEADGLSVPIVPIDIGGGVTFNANEYVEYTLLEGDIDISGIWTARVTSENTGAGTKKVTDVGINFTVNP